jgi:hypothetical protein
LLTCKETEGFPIFGSKSASGSKVVWWSRWSIKQRKKV